MENTKKLDYSQISAEEITDPAKYSPDDFSAWRRYHAIQNDTEEQNKSEKELEDQFLAGFNASKNKRW